MAGLAVSQGVFDLIERVDFINHRFDDTTFEQLRNFRLPEAAPTIEKYLKLGAIGIGEQKFFVDCDSPHIAKISELARSYDVPILLLKT